MASKQEDVSAFITEIQNLVAYYAREYSMNYPSMIGAMILWGTPAIAKDENVKRFTSDLMDKIQSNMAAGIISFHEVVGCIRLVQDQISADLREKGERGF